MIVWTIVCSWPCRISWPVAEEQADAQLRHRPGLIDTAMGARVPEEGQIASVVDFLVSDAASFITCATIDVNGGL
jgi:NAD(P)-dependent dehydrogenase (short-subunit alcohol dehydrogenase family)